jgi:S1-C subfamily serine protease
VVTDVDPGSPAELIQIKPGDLITEVDGRKISSIQEFYEALKKSDLRVGVRLNLLRGRVSRVETLKTPGP